MIHTSVQSEARGVSDIAYERRRDDRVMTHGEVILAWDQDLTQYLRFQLVDLSQFGMRIRGRFPILSGAGGIAISLLPERATINRVLTVRWVEGPDDTGLYEAGVEFVDAAV